MAGQAPTDITTKSPLTRLWILSLECDAGADDRVIENPRRDPLRWSIPYQSHLKLKAHPNDMAKLGQPMAVDGKQVGADFQAP